MQPSTVGQIERKTQNRVVKLFRDELEYTYLGHWEDRPNNSNIEEELLTSYLSKKGYNSTFINKALHGLHVTASNHNESLYTNNKNVYKLLRYGVQVKAEAGENFETVRQTSRDKMKSILDEWYRKQLKASLPALIEKWERTINVQVNEFGIKKWMRSCPS